MAAVLVVFYDHAHATTLMQHRRCRPGIAQGYEVIYMTDVLDEYVMQVRLPKPVMSWVSPTCACAR